MTTVGERIFYYRKQRGFIQAKLAEKLEASFQPVSSRERDEYLPETAKL